MFSSLSSLQLILQSSFTVRALFLALAISNFVIADCANATSRQK